MFECCDIPTHMCQFPTELIIYIFKFLPAKNLIACRQVCKRWNEIVENVSNDDNMWKEYCKRDYKTLYEEAMNKSSSCRLWFDIYRSLTLWCRLSDATEVIDEFCHSAISFDEIQDMYLLKNDIMLIQKRVSVVYYDISTLEPSERTPVYGEFAKFVEHYDILIILGNELHLRLIKKVKDSESQTDKLEETRYRQTKYFMTFGKYVYFVNFNDTIFYCDIEKSLRATELPHNYSGTVITLSLYNDSLHFITVERNVFKYEKDTFVKLFDLESKKSNIFDFLWRYEFLGHIHWHVFYMWITGLRITIPEGPLRYICMMKVYGDTFFVGCKTGMVLIYYKPYVDGKLDLFSHTPIKKYNFGEREDIPVLSLYPILKIEVSEVKGGHKIFVAMPKKIITVTYVHNFEVVTSKAVVPYVPPRPVVSV